LEQPSYTNWIRLRFLIILLGEYNHWWSTRIITDKGEEFLSYVLPKTKTAAAHQLAVEICRLQHDAQIGPGRYHIFRLPQKWEEHIFQDLNKIACDYEVITENAAMQELVILSESISVSTAKGPLLIGADAELNDISVFQSFARHYYDAFKNNYKTYPYLN
jgi:hypothetical protein